MSGMTDASASSKLYFDANVFIYAVEGSDDIAGRLRTLFELLNRAVNLAVTSELTLAEVLPKANPIRRRNYLELILHSGLFDLHPVTRDILMELGRRRMVGGQEDMIFDVALDMLAAQRRGRAQTSSGELP